MKLVVLISLALIVVINAQIGAQKGDIVHVNLDEVAVTKELVDQINAMTDNTWKASIQQSRQINQATFREVKALLGVRPGGPKLKEKTEFEADGAPIPDTFDSRTNWPDCPTIKVIRDQSACGTCWAFGAVEAISDRYCTYKVNTNLSIAAGDIGFCCDDCGYGCEGGFPAAAWEYWTETGSVDEDCYPYPFPSCDHHIVNSKNPCPSSLYPSPDCPNKCKNGKNWDQQKHYGSKSYSVSGEQNIQKEIFTNGPVETAFNVYQDFLTYKSGVYQKKSNQYLGGHAVKILGWGVEGGVKYWLVANSWNPNWGDQGYFKIIRGKNECGIENSCNGGVPKN